MHVAGRQSRASEACSLAISPYYASQRCHPYLRVVCVPTQGGVSEALKTANRSLIEKVRAQLSSEARFGSFREDSGKFLRGAMTARDYHENMVGREGLGGQP